MAFNPKKIQAAFDFADNSIKPSKRFKHEKAHELLDELKKNLGVERVKGGKPWAPTPYKEFSNDEIFDLVTKALIRGSDNTNKNAEDGNPFRTLILLSHEDKFKSVENLGKINNKPTGLVLKELDLTKLPTETAAILKLNFTDVKFKNCTFDTSNMNNLLLGNFENCKNQHGEELTPVNIRDMAIQYVSKPLENDYYDLDGKLKRQYKIQNNEVGTKTATNIDLDRNAFLQTIANETNYSKAIQTLKDNLYFKSNLGNENIKLTQQDLAIYAE